VKDITTKNGVLEATRCMTGKKRGGGISTMYEGGENNAAVYLNTTVLCPLSKMRQFMRPGLIRLRSHCFCCTRRQLLPSARSANCTAPPSTPHQANDVRFTIRHIHQPGSGEPFCNFDHALIALDPTQAFLLPVSHAVFVPELPRPHAKVCDTQRQAFRRDHVRCVQIFPTLRSRCQTTSTPLPFRLALQTPTVTNPRGIAAYGLTVDIARDTFGKPIAITRGVGGVSATRRYVYDGNQRLCKTIEPETGATVQDYDAANNTIWRASGLALPSTGSCDTASVPTNKKIGYTYDTLNRLTATTYRDASPSITNGNVAAMQDIQKTLQPAP
jgi:hypothetical protein